MGSWLATTSMGNSPAINVEVWTDGTYRNGTVITAYAALCLKALRGQSWWGYGVNVSWGWCDAAGCWVQGQDIVLKLNSETQWDDTWRWVSFTVDTGSYDAGALNAAFCVYPNTGSWGTSVNPQFWYDSGYVAPSRGNVAAEIPPPNEDVWFENINISWDSFSGGTSGISYYGIFKQECDTWNGVYSYGSGIAQIWTSGSGGQLQWNGLPTYPMYYFRNVATGKYLDVNDGLFQNNQPVNTYEFNGRQAQRWGLEYIPGESYAVYYFHPDSAYEALLEVPGGSYADGTQIQLYQHHGYDHQKFIINPTGDADDSVYIVPKHSLAQCIDADASTGKARLWTYSGAPNQKWIMEDASDAWRGKWFRFNVVAFANDGNTSDRNTYAGAWRKNERPTEPINLRAAPSPVNLGHPVTLRWDESIDSVLREYNRYEIELERCRDGGTYAKVGDSFYSNVNVVSDYTRYLRYAQPGDKFRFRVKAYDFFNIPSAWSEYGAFEVQKSGVNCISGGEWKGFYVYAPLGGKWTICQVFTIKNNQWTQCIMD